MPTWRQRFRPLIQTVILENKGKPEKEVRRALREAKPADARTFSSVNAVWLSEVKRQLGAFFPKAAARADEPAPPGQQTSLF